MSRWLIALGLMVPAVAHADDAMPAELHDPATGPSLPAVAHADGDAPAEVANKSAPSDMSDQAIGPSLGVAGGGRTTPGGLLVAGHYLYRLSDEDWFDGTVSFVFGGGGPECFRDRMDAVLCDHGLADGYAGKVDAAFRRFLPRFASGSFWPFARAGLGTSIVRFADDATTGITFSVHAGGGLRASVSEGVALTAIADFELGLGKFSNGVGSEPQLGFNFSAGAEFKL